MSSLIFYTDEHQVLVATDTLATSPDGEPFKFTTKAFIVPHLRMIVAGTGAGGFLGKWFIHINDGMAVRGIDHLDYHASRSLQLAWERHQKEFSLPDQITTTVYHFGFSESTGLIVAFAYRSTDSFRSDRLEPYGLRVKPECQIPLDYELPRDIRQMMEDQRRAQALLPKDKRVFIGGEIEVHHLLADGYRILTLGRFDDYSRDETTIFDRFK